MPYFPPVQNIETKPYYCPVCKQWYRTIKGRENISCTVLHSAGSCCHVNEEVYPTEPSPIAPEKP